ncbi:MAG: hypothetical protein RIC55_29320 [Pirellulaceae bacterium]
MKSITRIFLAPALLAVAAFGICLLSSSAASAQSPAIFGYGYGNWGSYRGANSRIIPYFAEHPPVYYSYPIPRPYGFSPYATPPFLLPAELQVSQPQPEEIVNPYFKPEAEEGDETGEATEASDDRRARTAQRGVISKPFFTVSEAR